MTEKLDPEECNSSMISLDLIKFLFLAADLQELKATAADVASAYIQAYTREKVYAIAGPEFGPIAGHVLLVV